MNRKIRCIITDDEPVAREGLAEYVERIEFLEPIALCEDALELNRVLQNDEIDLLFLDIQMPDLTGIEFLRSLTNPPKVVFTTAYEEYALQSFELDILDYLLKPISFDRFRKAAYKALDFFDLIHGKERKESEFMFVKTKGRLEKLNFDDILFIQAMENYLLIHTGLRRLMIHGTIKAFLEKLPSTFIQTHRSYIIASNKVKSIQDSLINIEGHQIPISRTLRDIVTAQIIEGTRKQN